MRNLIKNKYVVYFVLHALYFLQALLSLVSRILSFDYSQTKKLDLIQSKKNFSSFLVYYRQDSYFICLPSLT